MKKQLLNLILIFFLLFGLLSSMFIPPVATASDWIIDGDTVYIDSEDAYLSATPHTITQDTWITFQVRSKDYEGDIDACWLFDTANCRPSRPVYYKVGEGDWQLLTKEFTVKNIDYENMTKAYLLENINIQNNTDYYLKCFVDIKFNTSGKYWWGVKPSALGWDKGYYIDPWWSSSWNYYRLLTISNTYIDAGLTNFPVLVNISAAISAECDDGNSIRFLNTDNTTEYYYEIENNSWDNTSYNFVWVNVTSISSSAVTKFLMYYNNSDASDNQNPANVWDSNYLGVYHFNESTGTTCYDSTGNSNDGTYVGDLPTQVIGKMGYCQDFDGTGDYVSLPSGVHSSMTSTYECWFEADVTNSYNTLITDWKNDSNFIKIGATDNNRYIYAGYLGGAYQFEIHPADNYGLHWRYWGAAFQTNDATLYSNATELGTDTSVTPSSFAYTGVRIGENRLGTGAANGEIDEVRLSNMRRSNAWLKASFHSQNQTTGFLTVGSASSPPPFPETQINATTGIELTNATLRGYIFGSGGSGNYNYGFWIGQTTPVTEANALRNMTGNGYVTMNSSFRHNDTNLSRGTHYYARSWIKNSTYWDNSADEEDFYTKCVAPSGFTATLSGCNVDLAWTKGTGAVNTVVIRAVNAYATWPSGGTEVYNSTGTSYSDTTAAGNTQYYKIWSWAGDKLSDGNATATLSVPPCPPTGVVGSILGNGSLRINWTIGTGANTTLVIRKADSTPSSVTDGTVLYNDTGTDTITSDFSDNWYYRLWSYANQTYSSSVAFGYGALSVNCYDEETNNSLYFDVFVSNQSGSQTYESKNNTNPHTVNVTDLPIDDKVSIRVSAASNYSDKSETFTYQFTENETITYVVLAQEPESKALTNVTCKNTTSWNDDYPAFTLANDVITILADAADEFDRITVNYTHYEYESRTYYRDLTTNHIFVLNAYLPSADDKILCRITVIDEANRAIDDAYVQINRNINGSWVTIASRYTDGNGQVDVFLVDSIMYKFVISKTGFTTGYPDWTPSETAPTHTFKLYFEPIEPKPPVTEPDDIIFTAERTGSNLYISYTDTMSATYNTTVYVYGHNTTNTTTYFLISWDNESVNSFTVTLTVNSEDAYTIILYYNTSHFLHQSRTITIGGTQRTITTPDRIGGFLTVIVGYNPFGWGNFLIWLFLVVGCYYSDGKRAGEIMILLGGLFLFINFIVGFNTTLITVAGGVIPILFIFCGIIVMWRESQKKVIES